jgi:putative ABC transport system permease protein
VLGPTTRDDLFGTGTQVVGEEIKIDSTRFTIIGVTQAKGGTGFGNADDRIFIPLSTARQYLSGGQYLSTISVTTENQSDLTDLQTQITNVRLDRHKKLQQMPTLLFSIK